MAGTAAGPSAMLQRLQTLTQLAEAQQAELELQTKVLPDGAKYVGDFREGPGRVPHGQGELWRPGGVLQYDGEWHDGLMHGKGTYHFEDGSQWHGQFCRNELHGFGEWRPPSQDDNELFGSTAIMSPIEEPESQQTRMDARRKLREIAKRRRAAANGDKVKNKLATTSQTDQTLVLKAPMSTRSKNEPPPSRYSGPTEPCEVFFRHGQRICSLQDLENARIEVRIAKQIYHGTIVDMRRRRGPKSRPQHRVRLDHQPEKCMWIDLALYHFRVHRAQGKHFHLFDAQE
ncbi:Phosphatidylinositol 4-phosphate 5-kinase 5 [Hondaea fermentalgiana]|uniref:Phosphatidylinositol 4-phosphate 5-kinase 5 n=1 Tax=Hondaea fermentalgiana TaxID=2315210 RepID=A0A2R5G2T2_9STRA|nr:Phosphatidylinositol 4-phosphate 5-kinase 5 [Hondaea fermentalgiana]|eukprot:GBG25337.1 Phosphatidylinositol 4-phosphate 5-kinase 5 [Hondaea fermentalgiana]